LTRAFSKQGEVYFKGNGEVWRMMICLRRLKSTPIAQSGRSTDQSLASGMSSPMSQVAPHE
jgi:hypothetical protein